MNPREMIVIVFKYIFIKICHPTRKSEVSGKDWKVGVWSLVGSQDLVYPASELSDTGVDSGGGGRAAAASPGDDTDQGPHVVLLADQRATGVTLREQPHQIRVLRRMLHQSNWHVELNAGPMKGEVLQGVLRLSHHAGGSASSTGTDHDIRDHVAAPATLALLVGHQGKSGLLKLVGGAGGW